MTGVADTPPLQRPDPGAVQALILCAVLTTFPLYPDLPLWVAMVCFGLMLWRLTLLHRGLAQPARALRYTLAVAMIAVAGWQYGTLVGRDVGMAVLLMMLALKLLELRGLRESVNVVFLLLFFLAAGFLYQQSFWRVLHAGVMIMVLLAMLARLESEQIGKWRALRLSARLVLMGLPVALLLFLFFPRLDGGLWGVAREQVSGHTGLSDTLDPGSVVSLANSDEVVFRVSFDDEIPALSRLYWRALILNQTDGRTWSHGSRSGLPYSFRHGARPVSYEITLEPGAFAWLPALDLPTGNTDIALAAGAHTQVALRPLDERVQYRLTSYLEYRTGALLTDERAAALALPEGAHLRTRAWVATLAHDSPTPASLAQRVLDHFRNEDFYYTLRPPPLTGDTVDDFLFHTRRGFCEHYAMSYVVAMRAAGIPARIVTGYQGGEFNPAGRYFVIRARDAHAWAEIWLADRGWLRVDPTAAVAPGRIEYGAESMYGLMQNEGLPRLLAPEALRRLLEKSTGERSLRALRRAWDASAYTWDRWVLGYDHARQAEVLTAIGFRNWSLAAIVAFVLGLSALFLLWYGLRLRRPPKPDPLGETWRIFCRKLLKAGVICPRGDGPLTLAAAAVEKLPASCAAIESIVRRYIALRYGAGADVGERARLVREVRRFRAGP